MHFITLAEDYDRMWRRVEPLIDVRAELPNQVFRLRPTRYIFTYWYDVWRDAFWPTLAELIRYYGDPGIEILCEPPSSDWSDYGYSHLGAAWIDVADPAAAYHHFTSENQQHALAAVTRWMTMAVPSGGLAMWGEEGGDVAIFGLYDLPGQPAAAAPIHFEELSMEKTLGVLTMQFGKVMPDWFADAFRRNYGETDPASTAE